MCSGAKYYLAIHTLVLVREFSKLESFEVTLFLDDRLELPHFLARNLAHLQKIVLLQLLLSVGVRGLAC